MSKKNTPQKNRTPKGAKRKEEWLEQEDGSFLLSSDENISLADGIVQGLRLSTEKPELTANLSMISSELEQSLFFLAPQTMSMIGLRVGDVCELCHVGDNGDRVVAAVVWPKASMRLSMVILSATLSSKIGVLGEDGRAQLNVKRIPARYTPPSNRSQSSMNQDSNRFHSFRLSAPLPISVHVLSEYSETEKVKNLLWYVVSHVGVDFFVENSIRQKPAQ